MTDQVAYTTYFENLARNHKSILHQEAGDLKKKHFARSGNMFEFENALKKGAQFPLLVLNPKTASSNGTLTNQRRFYKGGLSVLKPLNRGNSTQNDIDQIRKDCEDIIEDIIQKMINDRRKRVLEGLNLGGFVIQEEGPLNDNLYGAHLSFSWDIEIVTLFDASKWNNETAFTI